MIDYEAIETELDLLKKTIQLRERQIASKRVSEQNATPAAYEYIILLEKHIQHITLELKRQIEYVTHFIAANKNTERKVKVLFEMQMTILRAAQEAAKASGDAANLKVFEEAIANLQEYA